MNLIKLNPLKKLMLVVLSWFVHSVYNIEVHAWHIGQSTNAVKNNTTFYMAQSGDALHTYCSNAGYSSSVFYIFPGSPTLVGAFYAYHPDTNKYGSVPKSGVLCLTAEEFNAMQSFFGNAGKNWGNCRAFDCAYQYVTQCAESHYNSSPKSYVDGWAFPVLIATRSDFIAGSGFSSALTDAYTGGKVQVPGGAGAYMSGCYLKPGKYINSTVFAGGSWASIVSNCKEGYYCPGGSYVGSGMKSLTQGAGSAACSKGYYCPNTKMTSGLPCDYAMYQDQVGKTSCKPCPYETVGFRSDAPYNYPYDDTYNRARWAAHPRSDVKNCFLASNTTFNDGTGTFAFISSCYYS